MGDTVPKRLRKIVRAAVDQGWEQDFTTRGHVRLTKPGGRDAGGQLLPPVTFAKTPSDGRGDKNAVAALRRMGVTGI